MLSSHGEVESFGNGIHSNAQAVPLPYLHEYSKHDSYEHSNSNHCILGSQGGTWGIVPRPHWGALAAPISNGCFGCAETQLRLPTCCDPPQEQPSDASQIHIHHHACNTGPDFRRERDLSFSAGRLHGENRDWRVLVHGDPISQRIFGIDNPQDIILDERLPSNGENTYIYEREIPYRGCLDQQMVTPWQLFQNFQVSQESNPVTHNYDSNNDFHSYVHNHRIHVSKQNIEFQDSCLATIAQCAQRGYEFVDYLVSHKVPVANGIIKECPLKETTQSYINYNDSLCHRYDPTSSLYVYIDGGYHQESDNHSTWSAAMVVEHNSGHQSVVISTGGIIPHDDTSPLYLGECLPHSAYCSELYAQVMARILVLQYAYTYTQDNNIPIYIVFDCTSADKSSNRAKHSHTQPNLSRLSNLLDLLCWSVFPMFTCWIPGHAEHPWNEYADSICTHMKEKLSPSVFLLWSHLKRHFVLH